MADSIDNNRAVTDAGAQDGASLSRHPDVGDVVVPALEGAAADGASPGPDPVAAAVFGAELSVIKKYVDILASRGVDWGLIGPRETPRLWSRHVLNSVALASLIDNGTHVADVGSGAGLPGLPLAILRPDLQVTLIEPLLRRAEFLSLAVAELGLADRVEVVRTRAEDHQASYPVVTGRAVAALPTLVTWCRPCMASGGEMLFLKGQSAGDEVAGARAVLRRLKLSAEVLTARAAAEADETFVVRLREERRRSR